MHKADVQTLVDSIREVQRNSKLHIFDKDSTASQICARIKAMKQTKQIKAVFIDYLQAYDVEQIKGETRDMAIGRFTRSMKDIALDLGIPVILLAQLSRSVEKEEREPRASDLRESGNIEQDADRIIFCHWNASDSMGVPVDFNDSTLKTIESQLIQVKNRNGTSGKQDVLFNRPTTTFRTLAKID
jgi:replicative DNA helicase